MRWDKCVGGWCGDGGFWIGDWGLGGEWINKGTKVVNICCKEGRTSRRSGVPKREWNQLEWRKMSGSCRKGRTVSPFSTADVMMLKSTTISHLQRPSLLLLRTGLGNCFPRIKPRPLATASLFIKIRLQAALGEFQHLTHLPKMVSINDAHPIHPSS